jgi:uncharacterized membrane protein YedE/YeeE
MMMFRFAAFGALFGFVLSRVGATDFDAIANMFLFRDLHLAGVIGIAIVVAAPALYLLRRRGIAGPSGCAVTLKQKPRKAGNVVGSILFGVGWAVTGTCPGTALSQLGEGKLMAIFTLVGIFTGVALFRVYGERVERALSFKQASTTTTLGRAGLENGAVMSPAPEIDSAT